MKSSFGLAVHALVYLDHMGRIVSSEELSRNICTNPVRVRRVMMPLKKAGIVGTKGGSGGGYYFEGNAESLTLGEISNIIDERFVASSWQSGDVDRDCFICSGMASVMNDIYQRLDERCKDELCEITLADIEKKLKYSRCKRGKKK